MVNKAEELANEVLSFLDKNKKDFNMPWFNKVQRGSDFWKEMTNEGGVCKFYIFLSALIKLKQPKTVAEMGADRGGSAICILSDLTEDGKLYSADIKSLDVGWDLVPKWDNRLIKISGSDILAETYPQDFPWENVDIWFIDSEHTFDHVKQQMEMIKPHLKPGAIILNHDIYSQNINSLLTTYPWDYWEDNKSVFNYGLGVHVV